MADTEARMARIVADIMESYQNQGHINPLGCGHLPSRAEMAVLLDDLFSLIFPGFFDHEAPEHLAYPYFVGERCVRTLRQLQEMIARALSAPFRGYSAPPCNPLEVNERAHEYALRLLESIPRIREMLDSDVQAALDGDPAATSAAEVITSYPGIAAISVHRIAHELYRIEVPMLPRMMSELIHGRTGIDIHPGARIGRSFFIDHGTGVVVGETCRIGEHVKLYQGVTLGALSVPRPDELDRDAQRHPTLQDRVTVYAGATILGGQTVIGEGSVVGGNVWLTRSIPAHTTVVATSPSQKLLQRQPEIVEPR